MKGPGLRIYAFIHRSLFVIDLFNVGCDSDGLLRDACATSCQHCAQCVALSVLA